MNKRFLPRRQFIRLGSSLIPLGLMAPVAHAQAAPRKKFVQFFLGGGWDTALASDPVIGSKLTSGHYQATYSSLSTTTIANKSNLVIGPGLAPAANAFATMNTAFINGMYVEVTAHELATKYLLSGRMSLSRSREYPAITALMGDSTELFPPHLNLGLTVPLGDTKNTNPPVQAASSDHLELMLAGPRAFDTYFNDNAIKVMNDLVAELNRNYQSRLTTSEAKQLTAWQTAAAGVQSIYDRRFDQTISLTAAMRSAYAVQENWQIEAHTAMAFAALRSGLASYITVHGAGYDTHTGHLASHLPLMQGFATALNQFVSDLLITPDPEDSNQSLADTTTILITSEFSRTPTFNDASGTDHWPTAAAIVMGAGVMDNSIFGSTGDDAKARGWANSQSVDFSAATELNCSHVYAALLRHLGFTHAANTVNRDKYLADLFSTT